MSAGQTSTLWHYSGTMGDRRPYTLLVRLPLAANRLATSMLIMLTTAKGKGTTGAWSDAYKAAAGLVAKMTNDEKASIATGATNPSNGCAGWVPPVERVGFPGLCLQGSGAGLRPTELVTAYAAPVSISASWNDDLAFRTGFYRGLEYEAKGVNVALEPICGPIGRVAENGRNWEGYGADPYLTGQMNYHTIRGIQNRGTVSACVKHFIAYEQETNRNPTAHNASVSANLDDQTMHELYLWPFMDAMRAESGSVMCSYNRVNNSYACQNSKTLNGLLKTELGFQGFVMSDWGALHAGYEAADAGLDMVMPISSGFWGSNLSTAVANGSLEQSRLDDMATRVFAVWKKFGSIPNPGFGDPPTTDWSLPHKHTQAMDPSSRDTVFQGAVEGHVLVKNMNNALPLKKPLVLSLFGYDALPPTVVDPVSSIKWKFGYETVNTSEADATSFISGTWSNGSLIWPNGPLAGYAGTLITGGGSSTSNPPYIVSPYAAFAQKAREDMTMLSWNFQDQDPGVLGSSDACIVLVNEFSSEGFDRGGLADPWSDTLVANVANNCNNTIVVIHNAGIRVVDAWIDHPNITPWSWLICLVKMRAVRWLTSYMGTCPHLGDCHTRCPSRRLTLVTSLSLFTPMRLLVTTPRVRDRGLSVYPVAQSSNTFFVHSKLYRRCLH